MGLRVSCNESVLVHIDLTCVQFFYYFFFKLEMEDVICIAELVAVCVEAAERACGKIREISASGNLKPIEKGDGTDALTGGPLADTQTEADRQSERIIFSILRKQFPNLVLIGEEESSNYPSDANEGELVLSPRASDSKSKVLNNLKTSSNEILVPCSELTLFVDPLDGTNGFVNGRLHTVSVLIGIARNGIRLAGVIARPFPDDAICSGELMYGLVGSSVYLDHRPISSPNLPVDARALKLVTSRKRPGQVADRVYQLLEPCEVEKQGGAGFKIWLVVIGESDSYVYPRPGTKKWDVLAGDAIMAALGGVITDACGRQLVYTSDPDNFNNDWGVVASMNRQMHYTQLIPACHKALSEAASDPNLSQWPSGLQIPPITIESSL